MNIRAILSRSFQASILIITLSISTSANAFFFSGFFKNLFFPTQPVTNEKPLFVKKPETKPTITGIVLQSGGDFDHNNRDYDILLNAVITAGLDGVLDDTNADLTVLAPDDFAFILLAKDLGYKGHDEEGAFNTIVTALTDLGKGNPIPLLTDILTYHVIGESLSLKQIIRSKTIEMFSGKSIIPSRLQLIDGEPELHNPRLKIASSNIDASNGTIHTISRVLIPVDLDNSPADAADITTIVAGSVGVFDHNYYDFDLLLNAVLTAGLDDELATLQNLTVFAPNDLAFVNLARMLGYTGFDEAEAFSTIVALLTDLGDGDPIPLLTSILLYHVSPLESSLTGIVESDEITTLLGDASISVMSRTLIDQDPGLRDPRLIIRSGNIRAANGFIHPISNVLIPINVTEILSDNSKH